MNIVQSSLVILGANTATPQILWNGVEIPVVGGAIVWDGTKHAITLSIREDTTVAEMKASGINIKRV